MNNNTEHHEMSEETRSELFIYYSQMPNTGAHYDYVTKRMGLIWIGLSEEEADELCRPREIDTEAIMANVMEEQKRDLRNLAKLDKERNKAAKLIKSNPILKNEKWVGFIEPDQAPDLKVIDK
jgi:hypothetical protein